MRHPEQVQGLPNRIVRFGKVRLLVARPHVHAFKTGWFHPAKAWRTPLQGRSQPYKHLCCLVVVKNMHGIELLIFPQSACQPLGQLARVDRLKAKAENLHRRAVQKRPPDHHLAAPNAVRQ